MKVIGITGRSGCGKSTLTNMIREQKYPCVDADQLSRNILEPGSSCLDPLAEAFGKDILDDNGALRRRLLADRAFATPEGTARLNEITHPEIFNRLEQAIAQADAAGERLFFLDGAVIIGTPFETRCDKIILITAPYEVSVQRICARDGISPEMARRRLDAQLPETTLWEAADFVIENNGTISQMEQQCQALLDALRKEAYGQQEANPPVKP